MAQVLLGDTLLQVFCEIENALALAPVMVAPVNVRVLPPVFVMVMLSGEEVEAAGVLGKASAEVESVAAGGAVGVELEELPPQPASSPRATNVTASPGMRERKLTPMKVADCAVSR